MLIAKLFFIFSGFQINNQSRLNGLQEYAMRSEVFPSRITSIPTIKLDQKSREIYTRLSKCSSFRYDRMNH